MKIKLIIALLLCCPVLNTLAQEHYQLMGLAVSNFLQARDNKFDEIPVTWNMKGIIQADLNDGINYLLEDRPGLAEGSFNIVLTKDQTLWQAYYYRAIARKQQELYSNAIDDLQAAIKLNPKLYEAQVELAKCYLVTNLWIESENAVRRAIQLDKTRAAAYYVKGCIYESQRKGNAALSSFRDCLKADSLYHDARIHIALIELGENKDEPKAIKELTSVLTIDSLQHDALVMRSILTFDKNKQQSLHDLTMLISVSPTNIIGYYLRGMLHTNMQQYDRGFSDFQQVIRATNTSDNNFVGQQTWVDKKIDIQNVGAYTLTRVYGLSDDDAAKLKRAYCLIMTRAYDKSIAALNSTSDPDGEPLAVYLRAVAYEHKGNHNQAFVLYNEAVKLDDGIADAYKKLGIYEQELKRWENSITNLTKVLKLLPDTYVIYKIRGVSYHYNKQYDKAIADFTVYLEHDPTNKDVIGYRGVSYLNSNQRLNAYIDFSNSQNPQAFNVKDVLHLIDSVLQKGDTTFVLAALTSFVKSGTSFTEAYALKMKLHLAQNDWRPVESGLFDALRSIRADAPKEDHAYLLIVKGLVMKKNNHPDDALDAFNQAIRYDKSNALAYLERGKFLLTQNKTSKAIDDLERSASFGNVEADKLLKGLRN